ncbi:TPM domain-containing protein [Novosphingobium sp. 1949]|uniref:TPM domain-containing protein n=1 Tax=Novosphingobium organovorum TaxID=2930092 RepID=A0ABT0BB67_9SPHN|nr:TPM domain-containing protein [Novosphingobium organovorum]MCJ2182297.1 TPM domain-containing protein [Novosphingobium organovorum]
MGSDDRALSRSAVIVRRLARALATGLLLATLGALPACGRTASKPEASRTTASAPSASDTLVLHGRVNDAANALAPESEARLDAQLAALEQRTGHQMVIATTPSLGGEPIARYSLALARRWKIGRKGIDDGVLIVLAPQDRTVRIEVGYGLEKALPDALCARIIQQDMLGAFRREDYAAGLEAGIGARIAHLPAD